MENLDCDNPQASATPNQADDQPDQYVVDSNDPIPKRTWEALKKLSSKDRLALLYRLFRPGKTHLKVERPATRGRPPLPLTLAEQIAERHGMSVEEEEEHLDEHGY